ncbi:SigE family RNA polymerase sigma factor [Kribbella sandramycini]|uniref:RNA polymerase sigma-70 factor (Sigma-E family) n=1 Tax=Kribbella sandramycini TaxID=60450 RepID=A0A7Y4L5E2_9ACTN|nr:SigE family RNA polymerase sigma factor [Kribbella sandramycini]MBB6566987.1 RNA polymerase sigma-70 factor (sigma-E family) [Kribbella sandramycini]NOL44709.1 SigE family RNA polymerase sigma factor [Kribbella sandramycini]
MTDDSDFTAYVAARWGALVRAAMLLGCSDPEAEDLVQTVLERCLVKWAKVRVAEDRDAYVHRILVNTFISSRRRRWSGERPVAVFPERATPDETAGVDMTDAVMRALERLGQDQRAAVVLRYYAHLTDEQAAAALGVAVGTVKSRLSRASKILAEDPGLAELRGAR